MTSSRHQQRRPALRRPSFRRLLIPLAFWLVTTYAWSQTEAPSQLRVREYVTDITGTLSSETIRQLNEQLRQFDRQTSTQIVVVMIPTLNNEPIEEVSLKIAEENGIGKKGKDNGALLLVARNDRKLRIEVGYGLEGVLTDALSSRIIRNEIAPRFRNGDYDGGIIAGVDAIMRATRNEYTADPEAEGGKGGKFSSILTLLFILFIVSRFFFRSGRRGRGGRFLPIPPIGGWGSGGGFGGGGFGGGGFSGGGGSFGGGGSSGGW